MRSSSWLNRVWNSVFPQLAAGDRAGLLRANRAAVSKEPILFERLEPGLGRRLLLTTGDGFDYREAAQDVSSGLGKVLRMTADGRPAPGNPFPESPYVYSYGHRNPQGLVVAPGGTVWLHEHGPRGGDEINRIEAGENYGWPAVTHGVDYSGAEVSPYGEWPGMVSPLWDWTPSIAPSGMLLYQGERFPQWRGDLLVGALVDREVRRLRLEAGAPVEEEALFDELEARVRDVRSGPDGLIYLLLPDRIVRVVPAGY